MERFGDGNPNIMLIGNSRLFYNGLLGNALKTRELGAFTIYAAPQGVFKLSIDDGPWMERQIAALPPYTPHRLSSEADMITTILIEPETISNREIMELQHLINETRDAETVVRNIREAKKWLEKSHDNSGFRTGDFDELLLNRALEKRALDGRVARVLCSFRNKEDDLNLSASSCARSVDLSTSRFLHLFTEETGLRFRSYRMWKRARKFLAYANTDSSLTYLALDLGYPDSTHFSHSIRRIYGLKPTSIFEGSRNMAIFAGDKYAKATAVR